MDSTGILPTATSRRSRRPSVRLTVIAVMSVALLGTTALACVLWLSWQRGNTTNQNVTIEIESIAAAHDLQTAIVGQGAQLSSYAAALASGYPAPVDTYAAGLRAYHVRADAALAQLHALAAAHRPGEVPRIEKLAADYTTITDQEEAVLQALEHNDLPSAIALATGGVNLPLDAPAVQAAADFEITEARQELAAEQTADRNARRTTLWLILAIAALSGLFLMGMAAAALRWLVRPLESASRATRLLAAGDLTARVDESGPLELARLGTDVNQMAEALIRRSDELNDYLSQNLEGRTIELETRTQELQSSEQRFRALVQHGSDLITVIESDGTIIYQSPAIEAMLGRAAVDVVGRKLTELAHPDDAHSVVSFITDAMKLGGAATSAAVRLSTNDGRWVHVEIVGTDHRDDPAVSGLVLNIRDVNERQALEEQLRFEAFHDPLTGLANRAQFTDRLEHGIKRSSRKATDLAVLFLDLDNFKAVNDSLGHGAGDTLLIEVGRRLRACMRAEDTVARFGGDEFALLIEEVAGVDEALDAARRVLDALRATVRIGGRDILVPASIGVAMGEDDAEAGVVLRNADVAMYVAKALGKNRYELYEPSMHAVALDRLDLAGDLDGAVERGEFVLEYQPVVTLATGGVAGVEALVRWDHPSRGRIQPDGFIPLAEETGAIIGIGRWVVREACAQACAWRDELGADPPLAMNVNVSARQLLDVNFISDVAASLAECGMEPRNLVLEITETVMMRDAKASLIVLRRLKELGVRLAIDDFGTGYSSLSYLRQFPFDILKIDRSFLTPGEQPAMEQDLERVIVELGRTLKLEIVAEGVERVEQLARLKSLECELGQGFYFARPMPAAALREFLLEHRAEVAAA